MKKQSFKEAYIELQETIKNFDVGVNFDELKGLGLGNEYYTNSR